MMEDFSALILHVYAVHFNSACLETFTRNCRVFRRLKAGTYLFSSFQRIGMELNVPVK